MNTPDQLGVLRAHLDDALAGVGSHLPGDAAPALLRTARRRTRTRRVAAGAGGAVVVAALVIGVGSQVTTSAGRKPAVITPATGAPSAVATPAPSTPATPTTPPASTASPSVADQAGLRVVGRHPIGPALLGQSNGEVETFGDTTYVLAPGADGNASAVSTLVKLDLVNGDQTTLASNLPGPIGHFTVANGIVYVPEVMHGSRVIAEYSADDGALVGGPPVVATGGSDQIAQTYVAAVDKAIFVDTPGKAGQVNIEMIGPQPATSAVEPSIAAPPLAIAGVLGDTVYLTAEERIYAYRNGKVTATGTVPFNAVTTVGDKGVYATSRNDTGGPNPAVPVTLTLQRLDPTTLRTTATIPETLARGVTTTPGVSAVVINKILYTTIGTFASPPYNNICVQRRDPSTLALQGTVLRVPATSTDLGTLESSTDGTAVLTIESGNNSEQIDLLGAGPAG